MEQKIFGMCFQGKMVFWQFSDVMIDVWIKIIDSNLDAVILKRLCKIIGMKYNKTKKWDFPNWYFNLLNQFSTSLFIFAERRMEKWWHQKKNVPV